MWLLKQDFKRWKEFRMQAVVVTNPLFLMLVSLSWNTVPKFELQTIKIHGASREQQERWIIPENIPQRDSIGLQHSQTNLLWKLFKGHFKSMLHEYCGPYLGWISSDTSGHFQAPFLLCFFWNISNKLNQTPALLSLYKIDVKEERLSFAKLNYIISIIQK